MSNLNREDMEARYQMFQKFALDDQRKYYRSAIGRYRRSAFGVNQIRATIALLTGLTSAAVGLIVALDLNDCNVPAEDIFISCGFWQTVVNILIVLATALPAFAAFFNMLADLYQWDKLVSIYDAAQENIEVADALSPLPGQDDLEYLASLRAYTQGALDVMSDETSQWGQSIRTPQGIKAFLDKIKQQTKDDSTVPANDSSNAEG